MLYVRLESGMLVTLYVSVQSVILKSDSAKRLVELLQKRIFALLWFAQSKRDEVFKPRKANTSGSSVLIGEWRQQITAIADSGKNSGTIPLAE